MYGCGQVHREQFWGSGQKMWVPIHPFNKYRIRRNFQPMTSNYFQFRLLSQVYRDITI